MNASPAPPSRKPKSRFLRLFAGIFVGTVLPPRLTRVHGRCLYWTGGPSKKGDLRPRPAGVPIRALLALPDPKPALRAIDDLRAAAHEWQGGAPMCFSPWHGLSTFLKDGRKVELLISCQCCEADFYVDGGQRSVLRWSLDVHHDSTPLNLILQHIHISPP